MPLFERNDHLARLEDAFTAVRSGEGRLALVSGEAGIGKTTLTEHFTARHTGRFPVYWGSCDNWFTPRPLGPFSDIALQMDPALLDLIQASPNWYQAATAFSRHLAGHASPVILVIEDIHWADEATLDMLKYLGRRIQHSRVLLVLTFRDDEFSSQHLLARLTGDLPSRLTVRVALPPLSAGTVQDMARQAARQPEGLYDLTGGNPFFLTEMLESEAGTVPASVRDLVLARVYRLSDPARLLAQLVSLIPGGAELWLVDVLLPDHAQAIDEAVERGVLLSRSQGLSFRHELARQAVAESLAPGTARHLHAQVLQALAAHSPTALPLARLVHHAAHAGDFAALLRFAPAAAQQASRLGAHREAAAHYHIVLSQLSSLSPATRADLLEGRSFECYLTGEISTAYQARQQATAIWRSLQNHVKEGDNLRWLSRLAWFRGKRSEAEQYAQAAVEILELQPPGPELAMAYSNKSQLHMLSEENEPARMWGERAIALAARLQAPEILVHALANVGTARIQSGDPEGWDLIVQSLTTARHEELHDDVGRAYANLVSNAISFRQYAKAEIWLQAGLEYTGEYELDSYRVYLLGWQAWMWFETGRWQEAEAGASHSLRLHSGASVLTIPALTTLAHLKVRQGDDEASLWLEKASNLCLPTGELQRIGPLAAASAEHAWWCKQPGQVEPAARTAYDLALERRDSWTLGPLTYWLWRSGQAELPLEHLAAPYRLMIEGEWQAAAEIWRSLGCPFELALALAQGDSAARLEALSLFERLGARPAAEMLKNDLREQGVRGIPRGPRPATRQNPAGLTSRELEVLALLAEGLTNAGIAGRLSISKKTAGHHVSALLGKLSAATRGQALANARSQGLID